MINPAQIRHFAQAVGKRAKSDPIDAAVIARFAEAVKPEPRPLPDQEARLSPSWSPGAGRSLRPWWRNVSARNGPTTYACARVYARVIKMLEKELPEIDRDIDALEVSGPIKAVVYVCLAGTLAIGIYPQPVADWVVSAILMFSNVADPTASLPVPPTVIPFGG